MRAILTAVLTVLALLAACGDDDDLVPRTSTPSSTSGPQVSVAPDLVELVSRPLDLPSASGGECPATEAKRPAAAQPYVLGDGPIYTTGLRPNSFLVLGGNPDTQYVGSLGWTADPEVFHGKAIVRGERIDGDGSIGFAGYSIVLPLDTAGQNPLGEIWFTWHAYLIVPAPGCYAIQVDGEDFSDVVVFEARPQ